MSSREFGEWIAFEQSSPGFPERLDVLFAQVVSTLINLKKRKASRWTTIQDVVLKFKRKKKERQSYKDAQMNLMTWATSHNAMLAKKQTLLDKKKK